MSDGAVRAEYPHEREQRLQREAKKACDIPYPHGEALCGTPQTTAMGGGSYRPSALDEMVRASSHHMEEAQRKAPGIAFLTAHPEFNEFITLIRQGAISI